MWARYIEELYGDTQFIEKEHGFISYALMDDCIHLKDIWVAPEHRKSGLAIQLVEEAEAAGRKAGKTFSLAEINMQSKTAGQSLRAHLAVNFEPFLAEGNKLWLKRDITQGSE